MKKNQESRIKNQEFIFFALAPTGSGISGSDRIFIEFARYWSKKFPITIFTTQEGIEMMKRQKLINSKFPSSLRLRRTGKILNLDSSGQAKFPIQNKHNLRIIKLEKKLPKNFFLKYIYKIFLGIKTSFSLTINHYPSTIIYSSSEFWMDSLPCFILKLRYPEIKWAAAWYQTAPNPLKGYNEQRTIDNKQKAISNEQRTMNYEQRKGYFLSAFLYWLVQQPIKPLISKFADFVLVNNEEEKKQFPKHAKKGKAIVVLGAVPLEEIRRYQSLTINHQPLKVYDAVFQGRFHPQKGVLELIDIWKKVVDKKPDAKLAMIGDGPLFKNVELRIKNLGLGKNVKLFGYVFDGPKKYSIFSKSKIVVHPAFYDSGGMASAEAMVFGLPCVGFNLASYKSYYPKGMIKVKIGDLDSFADTIIKLLRSDKLRQKVGGEAKQMIEENWDWEKRVNEVLDQIATNA